MNKKLMSFVLAMVLSVGLGVGVASASYDGVNMMDRNATGANNGVYTIAMSTSTTVTGVPDCLADYLVETYSYVGGILAGSTDKNGGFSVFSNGKFLMSFAAVGQDGTISGYKVSAISTDFNQLKSMGFDMSAYYQTDENGNPIVIKDSDGISHLVLKNGITEEDALNGFVSTFAKLGLSVDDLKTQMTDEDGQYSVDPNAQKSTVAWFSEAMAYICQGENYGISINVLAEGGATCTFNENGRESYTVNAIGTVTENYNYENGFLKSVDYATVVPVKVDTDTGKTTYATSFTTVFFNDYEKRESMVEYGVDSKGKVDKGSVTVTTTFEYSDGDNGYLVSSKDTKGNTTIYNADGTQHKTINGEDGTTSEYFYRDNGSLNKVYTYGNNFAVKQTTLYSLTGQQLGITTKAVEGDAQDFYNAFLNEIKGASKQGVYNAIKKYGFDGNTGSLYLYDFMFEDSGYSAFLDVVLGDNEERNTLEAYMRNNSNGYSALGVVSNIDTQKDTTQRGSSHHNSSQYFTGTRTLDTRTVTARSADGAFQATVTVFVKGAQAKKFNTKCGHAAVFAVDYEVDPAVEGSLYPSDKEVNNMELTDEDIEAMKEAGLDPENEDDVFNFKKEKLIDELAEDLGVLKYDEEGNLTEEYSLLQQGFYKDGDDIYAVVSADEISIMDGTGFHAASGEKVLVKITDEVKSEILDSGSNKIMFMGNVRPSIDGKLTMEMDKSYSGGWAVGEQIETIKTQIKELSAEVASARYMLEEGRMSQEEYDKIVANAGWIGTNTDVNLTLLANGNFSWNDESKSEIEKLREGWLDLLF